MINSILTMLQGIPKWYQGPYYSYLADHSPAEVVEVLGNLNTFIEGNGPFDGILGFSQGGGIPASYILDLQMRQPCLPPQFSFAIFISPAGPLSSSTRLFQNEIEGLVKNPFHNSNIGTLSRKGDHLEAAKRIFLQHFSLIDLAHDEMGISNPVFQLDFFDAHGVDAVPRYLHPLLVKDRIDIPTVHVMGKREITPMRQLSLVVQDMCDVLHMRALQHQGGHRLLVKDGLRELASSIEWAAKQGVSESKL